MSRQAIPNDQQFAGNLPQLMLEKAHDPDTVERRALQVGGDLAVGSESTDHQEVIAAQLVAQDRCLTPSGPGPKSARQQVEGRLVYPHDGPLLGRCLF